MNERGRMWKLPARDRTALPPASIGAASPFSNLTAVLVSPTCLRGTLSRLCSTVRDVRVAGPKLEASAFLASVLPRRHCHRHHRRQKSGSTLIQIPSKHSLARSFCRGQKSLALYERLAPLLEIRTPTHRQRYALGTKAAERAVKRTPTTKPGCGEIPYDVRVNSHTLSDCMLSSSPRNSACTPRCVSADPQTFSSAKQGGPVSNRS